MIESRFGGNVVPPFAIPYDTTVLEPIVDRIAPPECISGEAVRVVWHPYITILQSHCIASRSVETQRKRMCQILVVIQNLPTPFSSPFKIVDDQCAPLSYTVPQSHQEPLEHSEYS
jgi:hypothetical protein